MVIVNALEYSELIRLRPVRLHSSNSRNVRGSFLKFVCQQIIIACGTNMRLCCFFHTQDSFSYSLEDDLEEEEPELPPMPSNLLDPPMWNSGYFSGHCGTWQKPYTKLHRGQ